MDASVFASIQDAINSNSHSKCQTVIQYAGNYCTGTQTPSLEYCGHGRAMARYRMHHPDHDATQTADALAAEFGHLAPCSYDCGDPSKTAVHQGAYTQCANGNCGPCRLWRN